jgi:hypothetical protein
MHSTAGSGHTHTEGHSSAARIRHRGLGGKGFKYQQGGAQLDCLLHQQSKVHHTCILLYHALSGLTVRACMNPGRSKHIITGSWDPHQSATSAVCMCHSTALSGHTSSVSDQSAVLTYRSATLLISASQMHASHVSLHGIHVRLIPTSK